MIAGESKGMRCSSILSPQRRVEAARYVNHLRLGQWDLDSWGSPCEEFRPKVLVV